jgi:pyrroline-5-carboxylate reductase
MVQTRGDWGWNENGKTDQFKAGPIEGQLRSKGKALMSEKKLALIGGGQMGRALVGGMLAGGVLKIPQLVVVEPSEDSRQWWQRTHDGVQIADLAPAVASAPRVLLAVKPNVIPQIANQRDGFWDEKLVISIAAGIGLDQLCGWIGHRRVVRVMPNTPCLVGEGASAFCCADDVTAQEKVSIGAMLESVGMALEVDEGQIDAVTGLSGSGPAYVCIMIEAMADGGVLAGLPRALAMKLATQTVLGTAKMIAETKSHPGQLKDAVASPGGTTIAAVSVLEQNGVRGALIEAVAASARRSRELGEKKE